MAALVLCEDFLFLLRGRDYFLLCFKDFSLQWLLLPWSSGSRVGAWAQKLPGSTAKAQQLWCTDLVTPKHEGSSQTGNLTGVSCIGR